MAKLTVEEIKQDALNRLGQARNGIRYMDLVKKVHDAAPETPINTVYGALQVLSSHNDVIRPSRGLWVHKKYSVEQQKTSTLGQANDTTSSAVELGTDRVVEAQYYESFRYWLISDAEEVTDAVVIGGNMLKSKWGTPDVIGVHKPRAGDLIKFPVEIVSAEIKTDANQSITAFGQACAYRLFSHKTYIVMPNTIGREDRERLEALCSIYGVGLVTFELTAQSPNYQAKVRAQRFEPDIYYANEFARELHRLRPKDFDRLF
jgi:hypothetical protein